LTIFAIRVIINIGETHQSSFLFIQGYVPIHIWVPRPGSELNWFRLNFMF